MLYFITSGIGASPSTDEAENAIRHFSSKRSASLDMQSSSSYHKEDKYFLGLEGESDVKITRIRSPFERLLPKLIVRFPKNRRFEVYKIRYSLLSTFVFFILSAAVLQSLHSLIVGRHLDDEYELPLVVFAIFIALTFLEIHLVKAQIGRALKNYEDVKAKRDSQ